MQFTSHTFLFIFLPITLILHLLIMRIRHMRPSDTYLLAVSAFLFAWTCPQFFLPFLAFILMVYISGTVIRLTEGGPAAKKKWAVLFFAVVTGILFYYKYAGFFLENVKAAFPGVAAFDRVLSAPTAVPLGISFLIFSAISYLADIYRGDADTGSFCDAALYIMLFPKLVSGPVVLWKDFQPQIQNRNITLDAVTDGTGRMITGYVKKAVFADSLGAVVAQINSAVPDIDRGTCLLRGFLYMLQIYYDFSGYSDIATGLCRMFGFHIRENFAYPYTSLSLSEFWRRWHISLGTWFREYVYIPMGGNRRGGVFLYRNLFVVFLLTGIWHGAGWTFLVWGALYGILIVAERLISGKAWYQAIPGILKWGVTMILVYLMWILFMASDMTDAVWMYRRIFGKPLEGAVNFSWKYYLSAKTFWIAAAGSVLSVSGRWTRGWYQRLRERHPQGCGISDYGYVAVKLLLFLAAVLFVVNSSYSPFIYFQF